MQQKKWDAQIQIKDNMNEIKNGHPTIDFVKKKEEPGSTQTETKKKESKRGAKKEFGKENNEPRESEDSLDDKYAKKKEEPGSTRTETKKKERRKSSSRRSSRASAATGSSAWP
eukprot:5537359-Heterocapsa_arctica.AAC.1